MAPVVHILPATPFPYRLQFDATALGHDPRRFRASLDRSNDLRRRRRLIVPGNQHAPTPSRTARNIDLAMNTAERRGSM